LAPLKGQDMIQYWWIPLAFIVYIAYAYYTKCANDNPDGWSPLLKLYVIQCLGMWPIIARYSNNLFYDGLLFDAIVLLSYCGTLIVMGAADGFTIVQWIGVATVVVGLFLIKL